MIGIPGVTNFKQEWGKAWEDLTVCILFDNDHPRRACKDCSKQYSTSDTTCPKCGSEERKGRVIKPGYDGQGRTTELLLNSSFPPKEIYQMMWGPDGYTKKRKNGFDLRDLITTYLGVIDV